MTDAEIERIAEERLRAENKAPAPLPVKLPSREEWLSYNPGGDYDVAMKERKDFPTNAVQESPYEETQSKLIAAQKELDDENEKNKSKMPGVDTIKGIYNGLPEDVQSYALGALGYGGGKALRAVLPQENVMGTPQYEKAQDKRAALIESREPLRHQANEAISENSNSEEIHANQRSMLERQAQMAKYQHELHQQQLRDAQSEHALAQTLNFEDELARRSGINQASKLSTAPELTLAPRGGEASTNYALKFGATDEEARRVPSMSAMQQQNIPAQKEAWSKIPQIAPTFEAIKESPLILGTEGQQAVRERLANEARAEQQRKAQIQAEHQQIKDEIARQKAQAQINLENAQEQARLSAKAAMAAEKAHNTHLTTPSIPPKQQSHADALTQAYHDLQDQIRKGAPKFPMLSNIGKIAGRFVPGAGSAFAPIEAAKAKDYLDKKDLIRASIYGVGALGALGQATGIPPLVGAGDIMQIPAAGMSLYDWANEKEKGQQ